MGRNEPLPVRTRTEAAASTLRPPSALMARTTEDLFHSHKWDHGSRAKVETTEHPKPLGKSEVKQAPDEE